jgi:hypothetical protein
MPTKRSSPHIGILGPAMSIQRKRTSISFRQRLLLSAQSKGTGQGHESCWEARLVRKDSFILPRILQDSLTTSFPTFSPFQPDRGLSN